MSDPALGWLPIASAPTDGRLVRVYVEGRDGLPPFATEAAYHNDAGWCCCELRDVTHWMPIADAVERKHGRRGGYRLISDAN